MPSYFCNIDYHKKTIYELETTILDSNQPQSLREFLVNKNSLFIVEAPINKERISNLFLIVFLI